MRTRKSRFLLAFGFLAACGAAPIAWAQTPNQDFDAQAKADCQIMTDSLNNVFARSSGFFSALGWSTPSSGFKVASGPRVEIGLDLGADFISFAGFNSLALSALAAGSNIRIPSNVPAFYPALTGRVGIIRNLDLGLRISFLPDVSFADSNITTQFIGWGLDLRYELVRASDLPDLSVAMSVDTQTGSLSMKNHIDQHSTYTDPNNGLNYDAHVTGDTVYGLNWNVGSFGMKLVLGKNLGVVYPFIAMGFQGNSGTVTSSLDGTVTATLTGIGGGTSNPDVTSKSSAGPPSAEPKYVIGIDTGRSFHWTVVGESNGTDVAVDTSFRAEY